MKKGEQNIDDNIVIKKRERRKRDLIGWSCNGIFALLFGITHDYIAKIVVGLFWSNIIDEGQKQLCIQKWSDIIIVISGGSFTTSAFVVTFVYLQFANTINTNKEANLGSPADSILFEPNTIKKLERTITRLSEYIQLVNRNSNINLAFGVTTSVVCILILATSLTNLSIASQKGFDTLYYFSTRVTFVVFIEIFSFFFLRLYKKNLEQVLFLNNELTNFEFKLIALQASTFHNQSDIFKEVVRQFASTERNFILKKDETTVDNQRSKIDADEQAELIEKIATIFKK